jgi:D-alanyl-D-alanine carboxypeptidase (penicillin-binding protein 5/6)
VVNVGPNPVNLHDADTLPSSGLQLTSSRVTIPPKAQLSLQFNAAVNAWIQDGVPSGGESGGGTVLAGLQDTTTDGVVVRAGASGQTVARVIETANGLSVANADGAAGNPRISLPGSSKGDLIVHDGATNNALRVGSAGQILTADPAHASGVGWATRDLAVANGLILTNGDWSNGATASIGLPGTVKGNILVHNGAGHVALPPGENGQVLQADSSQATGVKWTRNVPTVNKGDIMVHNGITNVRQPAGSNGQLLMYDSTQLTGLRASGLQEPNFAPVNTPADNLPASMVLMDSATGQLIYGRDAKLGNWPASTTKTMTSLLVAEYDPALDDVVTIDPTDISTIPGGSSTCGIAMGQVYTTAELLKGLMVPSGNDCGQALARHIGNTYLAGGTAPAGRTAFVARMNSRMDELAAEAGTTRTSAFTNAFGALGSGNALLGHYISAYDLALIMRKIVLAQSSTVLPVMRMITGRMCTTAGACVNLNGITSSNTSAPLCWGGVLGVKGGSWTSPTFSSQVGAFQRGEQRYVYALMNYATGAQRNSDTLSLIEWAFGTNTTPSTASCEENSGAFATVGTWIDSGYNAAYSGGYSKYNTTANDTYRIRWYGSKIDVYTVNRNGNGNVVFSTDGGTETTIDTYSAVVLGNQLSYTSPALPVAWHYTDLRVGSATGGGVGGQLDRYVVTR